MAEWSFLTNHARVLVCIAHDPGVRLRDIATTLGITERSAYSIVTDLTAGGYVVKDKDGRRNRYQIQSHLPLREAITQERTIGEVLDVLVESKTHQASTTSAPVTGRSCPRIPCSAVHRDSSRCAVGRWLMSLSRRACARSAAQRFGVQALLDVSVGTAFPCQRQATGTNAWVSVDWGRSMMRVRCCPGRRGIGWPSSRHR